MLLGAEKELGLSSTEQGLITAIALVGLIVGAMIGGVLGDMIGRKKALLFAVTCACTCNALGAAATHWTLTTLSRTGQSLGSAMVMVTGKVYIAETYPRSVRGDGRAHFHFRIVCVHIVHHRGPISILCSYLCYD